MTHRKQMIHTRTLANARTFLTSERNLVEDFIDLDEEKVYHEFDLPSVYRYSTEILGLSEAATANLIHVSRHAAKTPKFRKAIAEKRVSVYKAGRIAAHVDKHLELIDFAATHSKREIEMKVGEIDPNAPKPDKVRFVGDKVQMTVTVSREAYAEFERIQSLQAQKNLGSSLSAAVEAAVFQYIYRKDPVERAERNHKEHCPGNTGPLTAAEKNAAMRQHQGRCTQLDHRGKRCNSDRWVQVHHIISREKGGTNDPENLTILCSNHHRLLHARRSKARNFRHSNSDSTNHSV